MQNETKETSQFLRDLGIISVTMVVDETRARQNIREMVRKVQEAGASFRPHFKTHQSAAIGQWFAEEGVTAITVSNLAMAEYFAEFGWTDITLAVLLNPLEIPRLRTLAVYLAEQGGRLGLTIDSQAAALALKKAHLPVEVWVKIDTGYGRSGIVWNDADRLQDVIAALGPQFVPAGLLSHTGHSYQVARASDLQATWDQAFQRMQHARDQLVTNQPLAISLGDTPCCASVENLRGPDELHPGNFVFFDLMQRKIGACHDGQLAAAVACPIVGIYPDQGKIVLHAGAVHLSREFLIDARRESIFGYLGTVQKSSAGMSLGKVLDKAAVVGLSQEHGTVKVSPEDFKMSFSDLEIGDLLLVWPVHSCLSCDNFTSYLTLGGEVLSRR